MVSFDSDEQVRHLRYAGRHRKAPAQLRAALRLARWSAFAIQPLADDDSRTSRSPRHRPVAGRLPALGLGEPPSAARTS